MWRATQAATTDPIMLSSPASFKSQAAEGDADMTAYWIARVDVTDPDRYGEYAKLAGPAIEKHGGRFLVRGGRVVTMEGTARPRNVVVAFDDVDKALACYKSPEYQEALAFVEGSAERDVIVVEGI
jgi:uncharacterized protein (DUF1330 family)